MNVQTAFIDVLQSLPSDLTVKRRLDRAYDIVVQPGYEIEPGCLTATCTHHITKLATSLLGADTMYHVSQHYCTCPDYEKARSNLCKHRLAVMLTQKMRQAQ